MRSTACLRSEISASPGIPKMLQGLHVLKFGGTSIGDARAVRTVAAIVRERATAPTILVFSAMGATTNRLEKIAALAGRGEGRLSVRLVERLRAEHLQVIDDLFPAGDGQRAARVACESLLECLKEIVESVAVLADLSPAIEARVLSFGELLSTRLLHLALAQENLPVEWVDARRFIRTEERALEAEPLAEVIDTEACRVLLPHLRQGRIVVTQGFLGRSQSGLDSTLGRGGSDLSATLLGGALHAEEVEIWTDVDGIMTADPSIVADAKAIPTMSFREAAELAFFGARVLHPRSLLPAIERHIPVRVRNTRKPEAPGTVILGENEARSGPVQSIAYKEGMAVLRMTSTRMFQSHGFLEEIFALLHRHRLPAHAIATSEVSVAIAIADGPALDAAAEEFRHLGSLVVRRKQAFVSVVGEGLRQTPGIVAEVFHELADLETSLVSLGGCDIQLGFVVSEERLSEVVHRLHRRFFGVPA